MSAELNYLKAYVVFKHVYTEWDTDVREYEPVAVFANSTDAQMYVLQEYKSNKGVNFFIGGTLDIDVIVLCRNAIPKIEWKWKKAINTYIWSNDTGRFKWFKSISESNILEELHSKYEMHQLEYVSANNLGDMHVANPLP